MTIKVLKQGNENKYKGKCFTCSQEIECSEKDIITNKPIYELNDYVECSCCGDLIIICEGRMPHRMNPFALCG